MDSGNVFELFSQAVNEGDIVKVVEIWNHFETINLTSAAENFADLIMRPLNIQGETCLEVATQKNYWALLNKLLKHLKCHVYENWRLKRRFPPYSLPKNHIEFIRDISGKIPITELIGNLISIDNDEFVWVEFILYSLMASSITREVKIIALELMGAVFIFWLFKNKYRYAAYERHLFVKCLSKGIHCWKDALILRDATADGEPAIPNIPCVLPERLQNVFRMEEMTLEELEQYHLNIDWFNGPNPALEPLQIQALLISYKILKRQQSNNGKTSLIYFFYRPLLHYACRANTYRSRRDLNRVYCHVLLFFIETFCDDISNVLSSYKHLSLFMRSFSLVEKYAFTSETLLIIAKCTLKIFANLKPQSFGQFNCMDDDIWDIYGGMSDFLRRMNQQDQSKLMNYFSNYIGDFNLNGCLANLLRVNAEGVRSDVYITPILQFFLDAGVDPNATDTNGQAPIHILARHSEIEGVPITLKSLLNAGAHIDQATPDGQTIGSILNQQRLQLSLPSFHPFKSLADNPLNVVLPLSCYCAQSIRRNGIPFENQLPQKLHQFVKFH